MRERLTSRDIQARETRERLIDTTMKLIAREGYRNTTISRICEASGVSVGTFYQYFRSKKDIIVLIGREHSRYLGTVCQLDPGQGAREIYMRFVEAYMERVRDSGLEKAKALMMGMLEGNLNDEESGIALQHRFLRKVLAHGRETGEFDPEAISDGEFCETFTVYVNGVLATWLYHSETIDLVPFGSRHLNRLLRLLKKR